MTPYFKIAGKWTTSLLKNTVGPVFVGQEGIYLVKLGSNSVVKGVAGGGVAALFGADKTGVESATGIVDLDPSEVPRGLANHAEWPLKSHPGAAITFVPRNSVQKLTLSIWKGLVIHTPEAQVITDVSVFKLREVRVVVESLDWKIE